MTFNGLKAQSKDGDLFYCIQADPAQNSSPEDQIQSIHEQRRSILKQVSDPDLKLVQENWFLSPEAGECFTSFEDVPSVQASRTFLIQPPCEVDGIHVALQLQFQKGRIQEASPTSSSVDPCSATTQVLIDSQGHTHIRISNILPDTPGGGEQAFSELFEVALKKLDELGANFSHVVRTWLYLRHMERDYDDLNSARRKFFEREGIRVHPASTGIGAGALDPAKDGILSLYAIIPASDSIKVETLHSSTFNEAKEYGAFFSRGMGVHSRQSYLYLSGTAAVDQAGHSVGGECLETQAQRMFENVRGLLSFAGAGPEQVVQMTTYLKDRKDRDTYLQILKGEGLHERPHTLVEGEVCRPELLCEIELIAIV